MIDKVVTGILPGFPLTLGYHRFSTSAKGELLHYTGNDTAADELRATVPPEGWDDYCAQYPEAQSIVNQLKLAPASEAAAVQAVDQSTQ